jgi:hypothetical protein
MTGVPHSGGSEGAPVQRTHLCPLHTGGSSGGQGQTPVAIPAISASYRFASDTLMAAPRPHAQAPVQIAPVAMGKQSEF